MPESSALWLASEGVHPRTMYEAALLYEAWVEPQELTGTSCYRMTSSSLYPENREHRSRSCITLGVFSASWNSPSIVYIIAANA